MILNNMTGIVNYSTGFDWDRANFPRLILHGAMFWICDENSVDDTRMFQLLLSSTCTA